MKRLLLVAAAAAAALAFWLWRPAAQKPSPPQVSSEGADARPQASGGFAALAVRDAVIQSGAPGSTPALAQAATGADGFVEARVLLQGKPQGGAHVRLYLRGRADRNTGVTDWRFAGAADTGRDGIARIPAKPGSYLAAARASTFAPSRLEFQRPAGEKTTKISLELHAGVAVFGRTVEKGTQEAVPLALVTLTHAGSRRPDAPAEEQARATTDAQGRFRIDGLEPGRYLATATAVGHAKASARIEAPKEVTLELAAASFVEGYVVAADGSPAAGAEVFATGGEDEVAGTASSSGSFSLEVPPQTWTIGARRGDQAGAVEKPITVAAGATARDVKIRLGAAAGMSGSIVAASTHEGIPGAEIAVSPHDSNGDSARAVSDASGAFAVRGLPPGSYDVSVSASGYSDAQRRGVTVDQGQKFPLRIELHQTGAVQGSVRDSSGHAVAFALVRLSQRGRMWTSQPQPEARSDEDGAYRLGGVPAGRASLTATRDGSSAGASGSVEVPEGGTATLDFQLQDEGVITGHVRRADGSPAPAHATVQIVPAGPQRRGGWSRVSLDESGAYAASVPAGAYLVSAEGASLRGGRTVSVEAGKTAVEDLVWTDAAKDAQGFGGIVLEPDGTPSPAAVVIARRGFWVQTDESGRFHTDRPRSDLPDTFEVEAENGGRSGRATVAPQQLEVTVTLQPAATLRGRLTTGPVDSFRVDVREEGAYAPSASLEFTGDRFELRNLPGGSLHVIVTAQDGRTGRADVALSPGGTQEVEIALQPRANVSGRAVDATTGQPVSGVSFALDGIPDFGNVLSGPDGRFQLDAAAGPHTLRGDAQGYSRLSSRFTAAAGQPLDLGDLQLSRERAAPGTIGVSLRGDSATLPTVTYVIAEGPADRAGVKLGDQISLVDGARVTSVPETQSRIKGAPGTPVQLAVVRSGQALSITIQRAP